ncbi:eye-specific diacylglycerol kinase [Phymastichus coffea]|uniref:eye-specific diacylglycerol kinase n=1 Tax=Phymastichus coffea TaxID=108790 RepID=UPI00273B50D2|nr:eye-specific diacylglycerol kinase [Phymastichus coffea]
MQRLRSTFKRSRTPTGAEMKSQSSLEVPKQVRSASFDEIQLEAQRQEAELKHIASIAMATSSSLAAAHQQTSSSSSSYSPARQNSNASASKLNTLRIPQLQTGQRSKSLDVGDRSSQDPRAPSLLDRSASTAAASASRWRGSNAERDNPPAQAYSCWHCVCVDEYKASLAGTDSWEDDEDEDEDQDDDQDADDELERSHETLLTVDAPAHHERLPVHVDQESSCYFVVVQPALASSPLLHQQEQDSNEDEAALSDCSRREGSPEIRVTLTTARTASEKTSTDLDSPEGSELPAQLLPDNRQRRRSLSRQEALPELPAILGIHVADEAAPAAATAAAAAAASSPEDDDDDEDDTDRACSAASVENQAAQLVVRDIFLTVPDLKRDRAASVDSCFNQNKNGKIETCYSLQVPQQSARSKSVDIVLPTEIQCRYTALLPEDARQFSEKEDTGPSQREPRSTPDWGEHALNGEHLWVPTAASGEFCYVNDCSKHGSRLKCSACRVVAHAACTLTLNFACKPTFRDVGVRQYREQKITNHHWVHRRSQKGKCSNCYKSFQSKLSFSSKEIIAVSCSWCKSAYHNRESCYNAQRVGEACELGLHACIIVPPSWIVKLPKRGNFKSSLRKSPKKKRNQPKKSKEENEKEDPCKMWVVKPIPTSSVTPCLVFINPKSGGNQGAKLLQKFQWLLNPRQVFDLTQGGPKMGLELFKKVPNLRILACGGDGTVGWVLSVLDQIGVTPAPAVGTLPLGTGNDLARALGWGGGYTDEPIGKILVSLAESEITILDRWKLEVERNPEAAGNDEDVSKGKESLPLNVVNNYFSMGVDAHIALEFHEAREAHPERFNSRLRNKMFYGQMGGKDLVVRRWKDLSEFVTLECDGQDMTAKLKEHRVHAILFLNIASYGGGTHPWGGGIGREPTTEDGLIEVVGLTTYQLPLLQAGGHGTSIAQCSTATITTTRTIPMQVDGEACRLLPSIIKLSLLNKATMLSKRRNPGKPMQKTQELERLKLPLMRIRMVDYENFHSDKERLTKTATQWATEPLELDAAMDLESLRKQLAKEYPMDSCCFLDSCTAERFFRIDRAQEQLHYVTDVVSEAIYVLQEGPASQNSQTQQSTDNQSSRVDRRKTSAEKKATPATSAHSTEGNNNISNRYESRDEQQQQPQAKSRQQSKRSDNYLNYEDTRQHAAGGTSTKVGSTSSKHHSQHSHASTDPPAHLHHPDPPAFISPRDRLFGLSSEVHVFSTELLEKTSDGILRAAKVGDLNGLKQLHSRGYSLLSIDATGQTGLHIASRLGHKDIVRYLIACAPPSILNIVDNDKGQTALHKAAQQKRRSICCMLVAGGAKLTVRDRNGNTPRELALQAEDRDLAAYLHSQEQFQLVTEDMDNVA